MGIKAVSVHQMPAFKKAYKKLHKTHRQIVDKAIKEIIVNSMIGKQKKGDLAGVYVYKFKINKQELLLAYEWIPEERMLLGLGMHENFYRDFKK
ncbi:MAG: type II toxin-antitoxin system RelE/ParE family toxin [Legionella sp.]|nr:type II toxin-antitoxin system RelE/ParE family toxin [Legionella sp.]